MASGEPFRWLVANAELDRVLEQAADERAAHLASLRARDQALAADVESLLEEYHALDAAGLVEPSSASVTTHTGDGSSAVGAGRRRATLAPGTVLGPYRIVRPIGRGGMGAVYEADEMDSGRRVALKILEERLHDPRERERFEREGRLAASLNHPHCVFVFAALEIDGRLAIAMELMEGTLADRLEAQGPLPAAEAVDAVRQLVSGLQAAEAVGILHRDIKPSNCFVDADGVVKIGDFGISRSLRPSEETALSTRTRFAATPAYASPEQLRGVALDRRADIYSLGATLYELLTGRPPFERADLMALLMAVANDVPQPPHALVSTVPKGLSQVVLHCLAKQPGQRFHDYDALARAIQPYSSRATTAATLGRRFAAGAVDLFLLALMSGGLAVWWTGLARTMDRNGLLWQQAGWFALLLVYFGLAEGVWGTTTGKALVGLTVVDVDGRPLRAGRAVARAVLFAAVWTLGGILWITSWADHTQSHLILSPPFVAPWLDFRELAVIESPPWVVFFLSTLPWVLPVAVFATARGRNGYAGCHDLATHSRVVERRSLAPARPAVSAPADAVPSTVVARLGAFHVTDARIPGLAGWRAGFDDRLRRPVWIREVPLGTPQLQAARVAVSRPTRLRWLAGCRGAHEAWDAYEAVAGEPLAAACAQPRAWAEVRWWLLDLTRECAAQTPADSPPLRADRVWILASGRAKLVDDPSLEPGAPASPAAQGSCAALLLDVVRSARGSAVQPWPVGAHQFVERLRVDPPLSPSAMVSALEGLTRQRAVVTRGWRAMHLISLVALPILLAGNALLSTAYVLALHWRLTPDLHVVAFCLGYLQSANEHDKSFSRQTLEAIEITLASRYRHILTDSRLATQEYLFLGLKYREQIGHVLRRRPSAEESRRAGENASVQSMVSFSSKLAPRRNPFGPVERLNMDLVEGLIIVATLALVVALGWRSGLMRLFGLEIVTADGRPASRGRLLLRTALAWAPIIAFAPLAFAIRWYGVEPPFAMAMEMLVALFVQVAGAVVATLSPARGIQDRWAGTWIVPR